MTSYVDVDLVIRINDKVSGQGIRDRDGLESAVARPWAQFAGHELYRTPAQKAGALFHGLASTQTFVDGNKRTAWLAAQFLLRALGHELKDLTVEAEEAFALCVAAVANYEAEQAGNWFRSHTLSMADRLDYAMLSMHAEEADGVWQGFGINVHGLHAAEYPAPIELTAVFRVLWRRGDIGRRVEYDVSFESDGTIQCLEHLPPSALTIPPSGHGHHAGAMPQIAMCGLRLLAPGPGEGHVIVSIGGEELFRRPILVGSQLEVPDFI